MTTTLQHMLLGAIASVGLASAAHAQVMMVNASDEPYCREFTQTFTIGNKTQKGYGTACLQPDGSWEIQKPATVTTTVAPQPTIQYVVQKERVYVVPPEPFIVGTILLGGQPRHFDAGFRPRWDARWHGEGHAYGHRDNDGWRR